MDELQYAAYCGNLEAVKQSLVNGAEVTASDQFGYTALHWNARMACAGGDRVGVAKALLAAGSNPNIQDRAGSTVLDSAIESTAHADLVDILMAHGAVRNRNI